MVWPQSSIHRLSLYFGRAVARLLGRESAWDAIRMRVPPAAFGPGSRRPFADYLAGESAVRVHSLDEIVEWLQGCEYITDTELFHDRDVWQHPSAFEQCRRGDCEDFALWAWRRLVELGVDADLVIGRRVPPTTDNSRHAWIIFRRDGDEYLFEPVLRDPDVAVRRVSLVRAEYIPELGVARDRRPFFFAGYAYFLQNRHLGRTRSAPGSLVHGARI